ncbi:MAG: branched-chain-amino-acid transaminase [Verrucomicrobia bacterium]|jgi:branched-chain amino acid aminotransferase|nr:branched-chain-amino-acid transaminase [Verrucomicrobiota bacterium]MDA0905214.1 branched-chain-amino-acid transaminase [Verrucomicrobiota bacterium]MDA1077443.1 branched-chain-amino-acid transaminase [Verrucomicrobiota bacterium]NDH16253.1 branched-chain-amino-acid transaminase [Opitutae bacterium]
MKIYLNGDFVEKEDAKISVFDHGLLYGDGVFEGIRLYDGCVYKLDEHLERLEHSAKAILLDMPMSRAEFAEAVCEACRQNNLKNGYIRLIVTRGPGHLGLNPDGCGPQSVIIIADNIQLYPEELYENGLKIISVPTRRINASALPPAVKSLNYLNNILAKIEAKRVGFLEALMLNDKGEIAECTGDNVFIIRKGVLYTPPLDAGSLRGITRAAVMELAEGMGIQVKEQALTRYDLWISDECFLTGTAAEVIPCVEVDHRPIGNGKPGTLTQKLIDLFRESVKSDGTRLDG